MLRISKDDWWPDQSTSCIMHKQFWINRYIKFSIYFFCTTHCAQIHFPLYHIVEIFWTLYMNFMNFMMPLKMTTVACNIFANSPTMHHVTFSTCENYHCVTLYCYWRCYWWCNMMIHKCPKSPFPAHYRIRVYCIGNTEWSSDYPHSRRLKEKNEWFKMAKTEIRLQVRL